MTFQVKNTGDVAGIEVSRSTDACTPDLASLTPTQLDSAAVREPSCIRGRATGDSQGLHGRDARAWAVQDGVDHSHAVRPFRVGCGDTVLAAAEGHHQAHCGREQPGP